MEITIRAVLRRSRVLIAFAFFGLALGPRAFGQISSVADDSGIAYIDNDTGYTDWYLGIRLSYPFTGDYYTGDYYSVWGYVEPSYVDCNGDFQYSITQYAYSDDFDYLSYNTDHWDYGFDLFGTYFHSYACDSGLPSSWQYIIWDDDEWFDDELGFYIYAS